MVDFLYAMRTRTIGARASSSSWRTVLRDDDDDLSEQQRQERDHHRHEDATFDANAVTDCENSRKRESRCRGMSKRRRRGFNGYDDGGDDTLTPAS